MAGTVLLPVLHAETQMLKASEVILPLYELMREGSWFIPAVGLWCQVWGLCQ